jgi:hypothetical protein
VRPIVFLHIPKTAGQTIHNQLAQMVGAKSVSPIRVQSQAPKGPQMPTGYALYSGHIDWVEIETLDDPFVFTVLREPTERIASFYFYLLSEARKLNASELALPGNAGKARILEMSAEDYFFGGTPAWQTFVRDHYDNFYCSYFATRLMRGGATARALAPDDLLKQALEGLATIDRVYHTDHLEVLEQDIEKMFGTTIKVSGNYVNAGEHDRSEPRWPKLAALLDSDDAIRRLEDFAANDNELMTRIRFARS